MATSRSAAAMDRQALERVATGKGVPAQRARAILACLKGEGVGEAAETTGLRVSQVRFWTARFQREGAAIFGPMEEAAPVEPAVIHPASPRRVATGPRLRGTDLVPAALARILTFQYRKMKKLERGAFAGNEEAIHDMRVAIRRIRAALRVARPYFADKSVAQLRKRLQETALILGNNRDLDVMLLHAEQYAGNQPGEVHALGGWIDALKTLQAEARRALREHLASKRYGRLRAEFQAVMTSVLASAEPSPRAAGELGPPRVLDILPGAIWVQYGVVRNYETLGEPTTGSLHALRIEIKRLRYILEFFRRALGARIVPAIEAAVAAQDRLGHLHDLCVAAEMLQSWLHTLGPAQPADARSAASYLATLYEEMQTNLSQGSKLWEELTTLPFRRRIARLVERL